MPKHIPYAGRVWPVLLAAALLSGCEGAAQSGAMVAAEIPASLIPDDPALLSGVGLGTVKGGLTDGLLARAGISDADLRKALAESLDRQGLLAGGPPRYRLDVRLVAARQGLGELLFGLNITVVARIAYTLTDARSGLPVLTEQIETSGSARARDYFNQGERSRAAAERAVAENIRQFLNRLYAYPAPTIGASDFLGVGRAGAMPQKGGGDPGGRPRPQRQGDNE